MDIDSPTSERADSDSGNRRTVFPQTVQESTELSQSSTSCSLPSVANTSESKDAESAVVDTESLGKNEIGDATLKRTISTYSEQSSSNEVSLRRGELVTNARVESVSDITSGPAALGKASTSRYPDFNPKHYVKCSNVIVGFAPVKKKKPYYAVLSKRGFELHESEKTFKKGITAKHIVDLATAFNIHNDHYDPKLKKCLCLMGPDETIVIRTETKELTDEWYEAILQSLLPSRQLKLGRPCYAYEIFEAVFDVEVVAHMKKVESYKKSRKEAGYQNICETMKDLAGHKRLCFYSHTVVLANRRIEPTNVGCPDSGFPPFRADAIVEFPRQLIAFFGVQDRYFFLRLGRGLVLGNTELLIQCESHEMANAIHQKMYYIIEREAGRRTHMTMPNTLQGRTHRERSHTDNFADNTYRRPRRASNTIRFVKEEPGLQESMRAARIKKMSSQSERQDTSFGESSSRKISTAQSEINEPLADKDMCNYIKASSTTSLCRPERKLSKSSSIYSTVITGDFDESSEHKETRKPSTQTLRARALLAPPCSIDETYSKMDPTDWNYGQNAHLIVPLPYPPKEEKYNLEEVRSYVSDSSDSCYSSLANNSNAQMGSLPQKGTLAALNAPRANSFGGRCISGEDGVKKPLNAIAVKSTEKGKTEAGKEETATNNLNIPVEDPRKRAFSLGSKNFFNFIGLNEFRRLVKKPLLTGRPASPNHTSTSGVSLNSSPASSSTNYLTSSEMHDDSRISSYEANTFISTSGSFGSGRSSPFGRHTYPMPQQINTKEHEHMEIDFSNMTFGRGGSSGSIDSPNRQYRREEMLFAMPNFHLDRRDDKTLRPSEKIIQQHQRQQQQQQLKGDYVMTDPIATRYIGEIIAAGFNPTQAEIKKELERHEISRRIIEQQMYEKQQSRELEDYHSKTSLCGLIVEEKEDTESNTELDDKNSDTTTIIQSSSPCEPSTSTAHQN